MFFYEGLFFYIFNIYVGGIMIKDLVDDEKPRERLIKYGVDNISNEDLISIILKTGTVSISVKQLSLKILSNIEDISELKNITINGITNIKGIGVVKAVTLIAALELGRRVYYEKNLNNINITNCSDIYKYFKYLIKDNDQERFYVIYLDVKKKVIDKKLLFVGTVNMSMVHPREVFKYAYLNSASYIVCIHNHPSGDVTPSEEDRNITKELVSIGKAQKIPILDHLIIGENKYYSFFENNDI